MRGGFLHNHILLDPIENLLLREGAKVRREYFVRFGPSHGFIDLTAEVGSYRIACEAELTADRVEQDLHKAAAWSASLLLIVVPHRRVAQSIQRSLEDCRLAHPPGGLWVLPLGPALSRLGSCFPFSSALKGSGRKTSRASS